MSKNIHYSSNNSNNKKYQNQNYKYEEESEYRIITKNLVYIIGLSENLSDKNKLEKYEYLGQYGKILKIIINKKRAYNKNNKYGPTYSAYITYNDPYEASIAILSLNNIIIDNHLIRASFGTTKYCQAYLNKTQCYNKDCFFLHKKANLEDIIYKCDINNNLFFYNQQKYAIKLADVYNPIVKKKLLDNKKKNCIFPSCDLIYENKVVIENTPKVKKIIKKINNINSKKEDKKIIEKRIDEIEIKETENTNSTLTNSHYLNSSFSSKSIDENNNGNNYNNFFSVRDKSRFDFVNTEKKDNVNIPSFVYKINNLSFKINMLLCQSDNVGKENQFFYIDELNNIDNNENEKKWKNFLVENLKESKNKSN